MKVLAILVLFSIFTFSCGNGDDIVPGGPNPVLGVWNHYYEDTDSLVLKRVFTYDYYSYFTFAEGKPQIEMNKQLYYVTDDQLVLDKYVQTFKIDRDTLWITNSSKDQTTKYIRQKSHWFP